MTTDQIPYRLIGGPNREPLANCQGRCIPFRHKAIDHAPGGYYGFSCDCPKTSTVRGGPFDGAGVAWSGPHIACFVPGLEDEDDRYALHTYCNGTYRWEGSVPSCLLRKAA